MLIHTAAQYLEKTPKHFHLQLLWARATSFFEKDDVNIIVDALQKQLAVEGDNFLLLGGPQGAHQSLKDVGTAVVVEQHSKFYACLTLSICDKFRELIFFRLLRSSTRKLWP